MAATKKVPATNCDYCAHYEYDDEMGCYVCEMNLDEDEMCAFLKRRTQSCAYFHYSDDYDLARKQ